MTDSGGWGVGIRVPGIGCRSVWFRLQGCRFGSAGCGDQDFGYQVEECMVKGAGFRPLNPAIWAQTVSSTEMLFEVVKVNRGTSLQKQKNRTLQ